MTLKEIVENKEYPHIEVRVYGPDGKDELFGECAFINGKLISLDGDSYDINMVVNEYAEIDNTLIIVTHTIWMTGNGEFIDTRNINCVNAIDRIKKLKGID